MKFIKILRCNAPLITLFFGLFASVGVTSVQAAGELIVAPTRVVFEGNTRSASVNLVNTSGEVATYRIQFQRKRMLARGGMEVVEEPREGEMFSDRLVRFAPRQVTLQPGQAQTIRLMLRRRPNMKEGEYRSHLLFQAIPKQDASGGIEAFDRDRQQDISINLIPVFGVSIPVIVRHGKTDSSVSVNNLKLLQPPEKGKFKGLALRLDRKGNASVYGDLAVYYTNLNGKKFVVGRINGMAVYTPNSFRDVAVELNQAPDVPILSGELHAIFREKEDQGGKILAEAKLPLR